MEAFLRIKYRKEIGIKNWLFRGIPLKRKNISSKKLSSEKLFFL